MTVNEKTKRALMAIGLAEEHAVELATDRSLSEVKKMTSPQVAQVTRSSPEEANRMRRLVTSKDAHDLSRRVKYGACRYRLSVSLWSVAADISRLADDKGHVDVARLFRDYQGASGDKFPPLPENCFLEMFRDDLNLAIRRACFLIADAVGVTPEVIHDGFLVRFISETQVELAPGDISLEQLKSVATGLTEIDKDRISPLDPEDARFILDNLDLAGVDDAGIVEGDTVIEQFPMNAPRDRKISDRHPDDLRWPSPHSGKHGRVMEIFRCVGVLVVEFGDLGRPRAYIHQSFCRGLPDNRDKSVAIGGFI